MTTSMTVVVKRPYSRATGDTSLDSEMATSPSSSSTSSSESLLVGRVDVAVEQADRDALDAAAPEHLDLGPGLVLVERDEHLAGGGDALFHAPSQVPRDQRRRAVGERSAASGGW